MGASPRGDGNADDRQGAEGCTSRILSPVMRDGCRPAHDCCLLRALWYPKGYPRRPIALRHDDHGERRLCVIGYASLNLIKSGPLILPSRIRSIFPLYTQNSSSQISIDDTDVKNMKFMSDLSSKELFSYLFFHSTVISISLK